jgi:hypothetical protein
VKLVAGALAVLIAVPGLALAANVSGTYSIHLTGICQSIENEVFKPSTVINTIDNGKIQQTTGFITFTPTKAGGLSGTVSANFTQGKGSLTILGLPGPPSSPAVPNMQIGSASQTGTYTMGTVNGLTGSAFTITFKGQKVETFTAYFSKLTGSIYDHVDFIGLDGNSGEGPSCTNQGTLDHN